MRFDSSNFVSGITSAIGVISTALSDNVTYQIIIMILTVLGLLFNIIYTGWKWYRTASKDGKITPDEIDDLMEKEKDVIDDVEKHTKP